MAFVRRSSRVQCRFQENRETIDTRRYGRSWTMELNCISKARAGNRPATRWNGRVEDNVPSSNVGVRAAQLDR